MIRSIALAALIAATALASGPADAQNQTAASALALRFPTVGARADVSAGMPTLKAQATVIGDTVRIGDLVEHAGAMADVAIFRAPDLGQTGSVPVARVIEALRPHELADIDTRGIAEVVVIRKSRTLTRKDIEARILRALAGQHGEADSRNLSVTLDNDMRPIQVEPNAAAELLVARLSHDPRTGRFDVTFELPGSSAARRLPLRFTGTIGETFEAAVLVRAVAQGEVLKASDIALERRPKVEFNAQTMTTLEQALGQASRRALRSGLVLRQGDLMKPELVQRHETVTIIFEVPGIVLTVRGKAMGPGALGDVIEVLNIQSKRTIQATVAGPGRVVANSMNPKITAAAPPTTLAASVSRP
jgi:flagella basal body P-ring formation protein FlgA